MTRYIGFRDEISEPTHCCYLKWNGTQWTLNDLPFIDGYKYDMCFLENNIYFCYYTAQTSAGLELGSPLYSSMVSIELDDNYFHQIEMCRGPNSRYHIIYYCYDYSNEEGKLHYVQQSASLWITFTR